MYGARYDISSVSLNGFNTGQLSSFCFLDSLHEKRQIRKIPYIYNFGNIRITLDYNIRYTNVYDDIFPR